ncbi:MAG: DUF3352 domain-containing protein, partial [Bacteroidales bacterium]|nr:DUF3352 domain-containing protein [Bacteroidales bacterium]
IGVVAVIFTAIIVYSILELRKGNIRQADIIQAVPTDAVLIINANDLPGFIRDELSRNKIWQELGMIKGIGAFQQTLGRLDSMLRSDDEMEDPYRKSDISLSLHKLGRNSFKFILYYPLDNAGTDKQILGFVQDKVQSKATITPRKYDEVKIYDVDFAGSGKQDDFSFTFSRGLLILSPSSILLEASIRQLNLSQSVADEAGFREVAETAGRNVEGNIYLDYKTIPGFVSHLFNDRYKQEVSEFVHFANWSEMDVNIRHDALLLNGFTYSSAVSDEFLNIILKHQPQRLDIEAIIPENISAFLALGLDDFPGYKKDYLEHLEIHGHGRNYIRELRSWNEKYKMDLDKLLLPVFERQVALVLTDIRNFGWDENAFVVCNTRSQSLAVEKLRELLTIVCEKDGISLSSLIIERPVNNDVRFTFYQLPVPFLPMKLFGKMFEGINSKYCTFYDNYLIFGNSIQSLSKYIHANQIGNNLSSDLEFHQFSEYLASRSNFYFYLNIPGSTRLMERYLRPELVSKILKEKDHLYKFQAFAYQITSENDLAYNNIILKYTPDMRDEAQTVWESRLESEVITKPKFVVNHYTGKKEIFVQDAGHNIYLLNNSGRILWKQKINGRILSDVHQIDYYQNGKLQFLFNTRDQIHLLDRNGNYVERYPVKLRSPATNGLALFDYEKSRDYRIFLAAEDRGIYLYDKEGSIVKGWNFGKTEGRVDKPLKHFRIGGKDYIVFADHFTCYILNRRGETRVNVKKHFPVAKNATFILESNTIGIKPRLALTDSAGRVEFVYFDGSVETVEIDQFTGDHFFEYSDLDGDGRKEFIFTDQGELKVYKPDGSKKFTYNAGAEINYAPVVYQFAYGNKKIGLVSAGNNRLYLLNNDGSLYKGFPLPGSTPFSIGVFNSSTSKFNLIVGSGDNFLYNYSVQ